MKSGIQIPLTENSESSIWNPRRGIQDPGHSWNVLDSLTWVEKEIHRNCVINVPLPSMHVNFFSFDFIMAAILHSEPMETIK